MRRVSALLLALWTAFLSSSSSSSQVLAIPSPAAEQRRRVSTASASVPSHSRSAATAVPRGGSDKRPSFAVPRHQPLSPPPFLRDVVHRQHPFHRRQRPHLALEWLEECEAWMESSFAKRTSTQQQRELAVQIRGGASSRYYEDDDDGDYDRARGGRSSASSASYGYWDDNNNNNNYDYGGYNDNSGGGYGDYYNTGDNDRSRGYYDSDDKGGYEKDAYDDDGYDDRGTFPGQKQRQSSSRSSSSSSTAVGGAFQSLFNSLPPMLRTGNRQYGIMLLGSGTLVTLFGVSLFFNRFLVRVGNLLFWSGLALTMGPSRLGEYLVQKSKWRASACLGAGLFLVVFLGSPLLGMILQVFGFLNLFGNLFPMVWALAKQMPGIKNVVDSLSNNSNNNRNSSKRSEDRGGRKRSGYDDYGSYDGRRSSEYGYDQEDDYYGRDDEYDYSDSNSNYGRGGRRDDYY